MSDTPPNPLFEGFKPTAPLVDVKENPFTGETNKKVKKPRKKRKAKVADTPSGQISAEAMLPQKKVRKPRKAKAVATSTPPAPQYNLQTVFAAMKSLKESDHPVFEKLLADTGMRERVVAALGKLFP